MADLLKTKNLLLPKLARVAFWNVPVVAIGAVCAVLTFSAFFAALLWGGQPWIIGGTLAFNLLLTTLLTSCLQLIRKNAQETRAFAVQQSQFKRTIQDAVQRQLQVEKELRDSERLFRFLTEHSLAGIFMMDAEGKRTYVNPAWCKLSGLTQEQAMGLGWMQNIHPDDLAAVQQQFLDSQEKLPHNLKFEYRFRNREGEIAWAYAQASSFYNTSGLLAGYIGTCIDITDSKKAEEALQALQEKMANIIDFLPDATFVIDNDRRVIAWNRAMERLSGVPKERAIGENDSSFTVAFYGERRSYLLDMLDESDINIQEKYQHVRRENGTLYAEVFAPGLYDGQGGYLWVTGSALFNAKGERSGAIEAIRDISARKRTEEELRQSRNMLAHILNSVPQSIFWKDRHSIYRGCNQQFAEEVGYQYPEEVIGKTDFDLPWQAEETEAYRLDDREVMETNTPKRHIQEQLQKADGTRLWVDTSKVPLTDASGSVYGVLGVYEDVTERRAAEEIRRKSEERTRLFFERQNVGMAIGGPNKKWLQVNDKLCEMLGYSREELECLDWTSITHPDDVQLSEDSFERLQAGVLDQYNVGKRYIRKDGSVLFVNISVGCVRKADGTVDYVLALLEDVTERRRAEEYLRLDEARLEALVRLNEMADAPIDEITDFCLETAVTLTKSKLGYIAFLDENELMLTVHPWPKDAVCECAMNNAPTGLPLEETGLWGEAVRLRKPIITNNYTGDNPWEKASPEGRIPLVRHMDAPVMEDGRIVVVAGVGNRESDYDEADARQLVLLIQGMWRLLQKKRETKERETTIQMLRLLNDRSDFRKLIRVVVSFMKEVTGCEAVGVRLQEGVDYPYYETTEFNPEFVESENSLCVIDPSGLVRCDEAGNPLLECMCGAILRGRTDTALPCFTKDGAFWTNSSTELLAKLPDEISRNLRNRCNLEGYESIALIPLRIAGVTYGLLQINDHQRGCFTPELIALLERLGGHVAIAVAREKAEEALRQSEERFQQVAESLKEWVWEMDTTGLCTYSSSVVERVLGYTAEEMVGKMYFWDTFLEEEREELKARAFQIINAKEIVQSFESPHVHKDGHIIFLENSGSPILSTTGECVGYRGVGRDVTQQKLLEEQLRHSQKMEAIGQLAGGVAHDFNNILQVIQGFSEVALAEQAANGSVSSSPLREVKKAATLAAALTRQLLAFGRRQILCPENLNLETLVKDKLNMFRRVIDENIDLEFSTGGNIGNVYADSGQIIQVLMNLCVNSRDAMPDGGQLVISIENTHIDEGFCHVHSYAVMGPYVLMSVSDTGCGMSKETQERIFEPFFTTKGLGKGTGLGLATVYGIVKQHNGFIHVYSELGKGTTFKTYWPIVQEVMPEVGEETDNTLLDGTETILFAEDDENVRSLAQGVLEAHGYHIIAACDGEEALLQFKAHYHEIALVLLDVVMPKRSGREVYDRIKAVCPDMPVLFCSGYAPESLHVNFVLEHGINLLQKPYQTDDLLREVRQQLDKAHQAHEAENSDASANSCTTW
ncbi:TPA: hypothetical protein DDW35_04765 [Candidatus Sumerlaeota bacterium]|jgi:PAS domain S-box-containing protein|nr:hypothetical protein [Candidatus Sumerlaeota bacterium]